MSAEPVDTAGARAFLLALQGEICAALERVDGTARFRGEALERAGDGGPAGMSLPRVLEDGPVLERAGVSFTHTRGSRLPPAATERRPELAGAGYEAVSVSLIVHPRNPYAPTSHANFRLFAARPAGAPAAAPIWWFGGGFDLTPCYGFEEDARHWHRTARAACDPFGPDVHARLKRGCDEYFHLRHRGEPRGIGGLFFDDWNEGGWERSYGLWRSVARSYLPAYLPILERRKDTPWGERERRFQLLRRGRYVEFNLIQDRGTLFGLQAGGRADSILVSLPPLVAWSADWELEPGSPEAELVERFLAPRDWLGGD